MGSKCKFAWLLGYVGGLGYRDSANHNCEQEDKVLIVQMATVFNPQMDALCGGRRRRTAWMARKTTRISLFLRLKQSWIRSTGGTCKNDLMFEDKHDYGFACPSKSCFLQDDDDDDEEEDDDNDTGGTAP